MKKKARIVTFSLIVAAALTLGARSVMATYVPQNLMAVVANCTSTTSNCSYNPYTGTWSGSKTTTTGTLQYCVYFKDSDCPMMGCHGTTTTSGCP